MKTVVIDNINKIAPKITIHPYNTEPTNQDVTVTASVDRGTLNVTSYTFTQNGSFTFVAEDEYGNRSEETVTITNIDKEGPTFEVFKSPEGMTNQDVTLTIIASDKNGIEFIKRDIDQKYTFSNMYSLKVSENGTYTFIAGDGVGNQSTIEVEVDNIDKIPPIITILPYNTEPTAQPVVVRATVNEGVLNATEYVFETNGSFTFEAVDEAGNKSTKTVVITNIDRTNPVITILPYNTQPTNKNVSVTAKTDKGTFPNGLETETHIFEENGSYTFVATTLAGLKSEKTVTITNINKVPPTITIYGYDDSVLTSKSITVTAVAKDIEGNDAELNATSYTFEENGEFTFIATDKWGNVTEKKVVVTTINREPPIITIEPYPTSPTNQNITVRARVNKGYLETDSYTFTENGEFTFRAYDDIGNVSERKVVITNIDKILRRLS